MTALERGTTWAFLMSQDGLGSAMAGTDRRLVHVEVEITCWTAASRALSGVDWVFGSRLHDVAPVCEPKKRARTIEAHVVRCESHPQLLQFVR